ncbi:hypothetical protein QZH46_17700 [Pseudomonas corrugata]
MDTTGQEWRHVLNQITNRHGLTSDYGNPDRADQLVLLDTLDAVKIKEAVARDKQFTKGSYYHPDVEQVFGTTNPVTTYAAQQVIERRAVLCQPVPDPIALNYWNLLSSDPTAQAKLYNWLQTHGGFPTSSRSMTENRETESRTTSRTWRTPTPYISPAKPVVNMPPPNC